MSVVSKGQKGGVVTYRYVSAVGTAVADGTNSIFAEISSSEFANVAGETLDKMHLYNAWWSANTAEWIIRRGANTILRLSGSGSHNYHSQGVIIDDVGGEAASNVGIEHASGSSGVLVLQFKKTSTFVTEY